MSTFKRTNQTHMIFTHMLYKTRRILRGLFNTVASIPTVSLVKIFLPSVSIRTDGEMNIPSVNMECSSPSLRRGAPFRALARGEGTHSARLFTPGEREALAKSKVHQ
jgi:hypothetical protein